MLALTLREDLRPSTVIRREVPASKTVQVAIQVTATSIRS